MDFLWKRGNFDDSSAIRAWTLSLWGFTFRERGIACFLLRISFSADHFRSPVKESEESQRIESAHPERFIREDAGVSRHSGKNGLCFAEDGSQKDGDSELGLLRWRSQSALPVRFRRVCL